LIESVRQRHNFRAQCQELQPAGWNTLLTVVCPSYLTTHRGRRVGVVSEVGGRENCIGEGLRASEGPHGCFQTLYGVARPANVGFPLITVRPTGDRGEAWA